jgi:hypothetical protein
MKRKLLTFAICFLISATSYSQVDTFLGIRQIDSCYFETNCDLLILSDTAGNDLWQVGRPQKVFFDSAYSPLNALVTDTIHPYSNSNSSYFDIKLPSPYFFNVILSFKHKYQTDSLIDGGYLEISYDGGTTWTNILQDTHPIEYFAFENLYTNTDTLYNGVNGFSGTSSGWVTTTIQWNWDFAAKGTNDDKYIRFHFISDSNQTNKAGWIIDNLVLLNVKFPLGGISEIPRSGIPMELYPNPADRFINLRFDQDDSKSYSISVFNVLGQEIKTWFGIHSGKAGLDVSGFKDGMYFVQLKKEGQIVGSSKFLKR